MTKVKIAGLAVGVACLVTAGLPLQATQTPTSNFDPLQTFAPFTYPPPANAMRDASGRPGPAF